jgi:hypothetical protein
MDTTKIARRVYQTTAIDECPASTRWLSTGAEAHEMRCFFFVE